MFKALPVIPAGFFLTRVPLPPRIKQRIVLLNIATNLSVFGWRTVALNLTKKPYFYAHFIFTSMS
jgi:hypothetical protein